jgi:endonuclease/exonuclease/phosphatase family metal-dependent hydrolase
MKTILYLSIFLFLFGCGEGSPTGTPSGTKESGDRIASEADSIKIGSFNIAELGNPNMQKDFKTIARLINEMDLIVLQEVRDIGGAEAVARIHSELNAIATTAYDSPLVIPKAGYGFKAVEGYAFIYRNPVQLDDRFTPTHAFRYANHDIYGRIPAFVHFKAGTFDFVIAGVHLQWENTDRRKTEMADLKKWLIEFAGKSSTEERDLIIAGDMNRYGEISGVTDDVINRHQAPFDLFVDIDQLNKAYRLITLEFLPTPNTRFSLLDEQSTTVGAEKNLYDQIIISSGVFDEYATSSTVFGEHVGVVPFDRESPWDKKTHAEIKAAISDHRPIWAKFRINLADDDQPLLKKDL